MLPANKVVVVPANAAHAEYIGDNLREEDRRELRAMSYASPAQAVVSSLAHSDFAYCGLVSGRPIVIFGVAPTNRIFATGSPWMVGTPELRKHAVQFLRGGAPFLDEMRRRYTFLENHVDVRNAASVRWLKWLGFDIEPAKPYGIFHGEPFHRFTMEGYSYPNPPE